MSQPLGELDYSIDQSTRVLRRVTHGVYRLTHGGQDVGEEVWGVFALRNGAYRCMTEIDQQWPIPHQQRAHLDVDEHWNVQALWAQVDLNSTRRIATYVPSEQSLNIEIVETRLREEEEHNSRTALSRATGFSAYRHAPHAPPAPPTPGSNGHVIRRDVIPFSAGAHLDFASALFNFVALQRLQLERGGSATFDSVVLTLPSLEPLCVQQTYCYERDEVILRETNQLATRRYTIVETGSPDMATTFWTDAHGIAIRQELTLDGLPYRCEMVSYRWAG